MTISVIVPAAGCGARAALNGNKILAPLLGKPLLFWTIEALQAANADEIIVVARPEEFEVVQQSTPQEIRLIEGGATRQDSVFQGVKHAQGEWVLVHDAARPCLSSEVIARTVKAAHQSGAAIAALPVSDTVKRADSSQNVAETLNRTQIWLAQTPQIFRRDWFVAALESAKNEGFQGTDCASILERAGHKVALVHGDSDNLKVTYASDLERAALILRTNFAEK